MDREQEQSSMEQRLDALEAKVEVEKFSTQLLADSIQQLAWLVNSMNKRLECRLNKNDQWQEEVIQQIERQDTNIKELESQIESINKKIGQMKSQREYDLWSINDRFNGRDQKRKEAVAQQIEVDGDELSRNT